MKVYKYLPKKYVSSFVDQGLMLFWSLSYFRDYEDQIRGDQYEGTKKFQPKVGLQITKSTGEQFYMQTSFESSVQADDIFVFCTSEVCCKELAIEFDATICVEIDLDSFVSKLKAALIPIQKVLKKEIFHKTVEYYSETKPPIVDWALPDKIIMSKLECFQKQKEYRFSFCFGDVLNVGNTTQRFGSSSSSGPFRSSDYPKQELRLGNMKDYCKIHKFT
ncbi:MAG: hypothetical protein HOE30_10585 [Deltaproteobacteria bacterium]|nr:hypothetical protein [Deltaproteobacteria bacterium]MBT4268837.1 hypothetical protein [Deltaproteobacteria bacterium]MBT6614162.1 hypothetical protein [Deltaproteobacteria bacterium]